MLLMPTRQVDGSRGSKFMGRRESIYQISGMTLTVEILYFFKERFRGGREIRTHD